MSRQRGFTIVEIVTVLAISATLAGIAVPSVGALRRTLLDDAGARTLCVVLRVAQARAQAHGTIVRVAVAADGAYSVEELSRGDAGREGTRALTAGSLGVSVVANYPHGAVQFGPRGWPCAIGSATPRAGSFTVGARHRVVVQLGGCIRCL
jgi:prepilin-type N-terminal cleavage/methylation domain-containing protein